ncbi:hypothetical protein PV325_001863 [Microctonus aethiopoides]|nr:hypothetical protein PV325_001863 [Microctonus aethiopoides]
MQMQELDPRIKAMNESVGDALTKYRSGKLPKAFKIISQLQNWEQLLSITQPNRWSATAIIRDDLAEYKRLNFHLYQALKKALFKLCGFMKGILLPLLESGTCTLREAAIVGSLIAKKSITILHSSAALLIKLLR